MPADDVADVLAQMQCAIPALFAELKLANTGIEVSATPRRIVIAAREVAPRQRDEEFVAKGPPAARAFDESGKPTRAAQGFARGKGIDVADLVVQEIDGGSYVTALVKVTGLPTTEVLASKLPEFLSDLKFSKMMHWNDSGLAFSRPIRWIMALYGDTIIPFELGGCCQFKRHSWFASIRFTRNLDKGFAGISTRLQSKRH